MGRKVYLPTLIYHKSKPFMWVNIHPRPMDPVGISLVFLICFETRMETWRYLVRAM